MKPKTQQVLEMCIKEGIDFGYARAHKHFDTPPAGVIKQQIEEAIMSSIWEWFDMEVGDD